MTLTQKTKNQKNVFTKSKCPLVWSECSAGAHTGLCTHTHTLTTHLHTLFICSQQILPLGLVIKGLGSLHCVDKHPAFQTPMNTLILHNTIHSPPIWANLPKLLLQLIRIEEGRCGESTSLRWLWMPGGGRPKRSAALRSI